MYWTWRVMARNISSSKTILAAVSLVFICLPSTKNLFTFSLSLFQVSCFFFRSLNVIRRRFFCAKYMFAGSIESTGSIYYAIGLFKVLSNISICKTFAYSPKMYLLARRYSWNIFRLNYLSKSYQLYHRCYSVRSFDSVQFYLYEIFYSLP